MEDIKKDKPIHKLIPNKRPPRSDGKWGPAFDTLDKLYCGADAYRRGVKIEGMNVGDAKATCPTCLKALKKIESEAK